MYKYLWTLKNRHIKGRHSSFKNAGLVHDCWASHCQTNCKTHQLCTAHLLRELIFLEERFESNWATNFKRMLYNTLELKKKLKQECYQFSIVERYKIKTIS
jgi:transposase